MMTSSCLVSPLITAPRVMTASMSSHSRSFLMARGMSNTPGTLMTLVISTPRNSASAFALSIMSMVTS